MRHILTDRSSYGAICTLLLIASSGVQARDPPRIALNIAPQSLDSALQQFAAQTRLQILFPENVVASDAIAPSVTGSRTACEGLEALLSSSDLKFSYVNSRTVVISRRTAELTCGYLLFRDTPLADVVAEFHCLAGRKLSAFDPELRAIRIGGRFGVDSAKSFLELLHRAHVVTTVQTDELILVRKP